jgi:hypothetical protein
MMNSEFCRKPRLLWLCVSFVQLLAISGAHAEENASNPLAAVNNVDLRMQWISSQPGDTIDTFVDGAHMLTPQLKLKYQLHYDHTNVTGSTEHHFDTLNLKPIYFPSKGKLGDEWQYGTAIGLEAIFDLGDQSKGIGPGAHQLAPLVGVAFSHPSSGWTLVPLIQHFQSVGEGTHISKTTFNPLAIKPFGDVNWLKIDAKFPYDWINDTWPISVEFQVGRNLSKSTAVYVEGLVGVGDDRPYDAGLGFGLRFNY